MSQRVTKVHEFEHKQYGPAKVELAYNKPVAMDEFLEIFKDEVKMLDYFGDLLANRAFNSARQATTPAKLAEITTVEGWNEFVNTKLAQIAAGYTPQTGDGISGSKAKNMVSAAQSIVAGKSARDLSPEDIEKLLATLGVSA